MRQVGIISRRINSEEEDVERRRTAKNNLRRTRTTGNLMKNRFGERIVEKEDVKRRRTKNTLGRKETTDTKRWG